MGAISRSENMRRIQSRGTRPELIVRRALRDLGYVGYRLHRCDLPGTPDVAFVGRKKAIFVHGCFWHGHECKEGQRVPRTNTGYWMQKIETNRARDLRDMRALQKTGWSVLVLWECELQDQQQLRDVLAEFMDS